MKRSDHKRKKNVSGWSSIEIGSELCMNDDGYNKVCIVMSADRGHYMRIVRILHACVGLILLREQQDGRKAGRQEGSQVKH